jgi:hypothetical protein
LAVVDQNLHRRSLAVAKDEGASAQGILGELLPAQARQAINSQLNLTGCAGAF